LGALREDKAKDGMYSIGINKNGQREWRVASSYLLGFYVLDLAIDRQTNATTKRLAEVMRTLGWTKPTNAIRVGKKVCQGFTKTIEEPKTIEGANVPNLNDAAKIKDQESVGVENVVKVVAVERRLIRRQL